MFVYADNAATTCVSRAALDAMLPYLLEDYGNPSSLYAFGQRAQEAISEARETVAKCLNAQPREIYFTSGGSEADNQAIVSAARAGARKGKKHLISTKFEHHAVLHTLSKLQKEGFEVTLLDVHADGVVRLEDVEAAIRPDTCLVTVMFANNEIGTVQPIAEIGALCREKGIPFHTDAVQAAGHTPIDVEAMNIDMLSISGHKFHAPKGVGVLYAKKNMPLVNIIEGGAQERGKRAGTENVAGIVALAAALKESCDHIEENTAREPAAPARQGGHLRLLGQRLHLRLARSEPRAALPRHPARGRARLAAPLDRRIQQHGSDRPHRRGRPEGGRLSAQHLPGVGRAGKRHPSASHLRKKHRRI